MVRSRNLSRPNKRISIGDRVQTHGCITPKGFIKGKVVDKIGNKVILIFDDGTISTESLDKVKRI
jgi:hypothetical protein